MLSLVGYSLPGHPRSLLIVGLIGPLLFRSSVCLESLARETRRLSPWWGSVHPLDWVWYSHAAAELAPLKREQL